MDVQLLTDVRIDVAGAGLVLQIDAQRGGQGSGCLGCNDSPVLVLSEVLLGRLLLRLRLWMRDAVLRIFGSRARIGLRFALEELLDASKKWREEGHDEMEEQRAALCF